ncbi:enolase C-terminal domain-like protein [Sphingobacterium corticibacterium]|uniref:Mandelate racemase/muconate lactonizing protein n=1 Tax=Sphingobacterium corticibacterium TaxID=2484746 RepID=A0A4Q6XWN8_9SPHI|nr:enolase C-terminal domain-like protein [Sphingobacterium corticibacterium]RZF61399.1 mandelate racemase/muconate lactonizing protein [Sphingobacterium corticibacterium]
MKRRTFLQALQVGVASATLFNGKSHGMDLTSLIDRTSADKELAYHRIQEIKFSTVKLNYPRLVGKNARLDLHGYGPTVEICCIITDKGAMGWASLRGSKRDAEKIVNELVGKKVSEIFAAHIGTLQERYIPFDMALHDLAGIILQKPVYALLGKEKPFITDYYSGMIYFDDLEPAEKPAGIDRILEECRYDYGVGYRQFKLKIGRGHKWMPFEEGLRRDIEVTKAVNEAFPDCEILVDGNNGFSADQFIAYLKGISGTKLFWIEEPFHETVADYQKLRHYIREEGIETLLADGEADPDQQFLKELIQQKLLDVHLTDIEGLGFTNWRRLMPELQKLGAQASPHAWGSLLKTNYTAHLAGGLGNTVTIEGVTSSSDDVDLSGYTIRDGKLIPPSTPGFGMPLLKKI